jgi:hypothetical protein
MKNMLAQIAIVVAFDLCDGGETAEFVIMVLSRVLETVKRRNLDALDYRFERGRVQETMLGGPE